MVSTGLIARLEEEAAQREEKAQKLFQTFCARENLTVGAPSPDANVPSVSSALQEQMGLKIQAQKAPVQIVVIDRAEKPSEN